MKVKKSQIRKTQNCLGIAATVLLIPVLFYCYPTPTTLAGWVMYAAVCVAAGLSVGVLIYHTKTQGWVERYLAYKAHKG